MVAQLSLFAVVVFVFVVAFVIWVAPRCVTILLSLWLASSLLSSRCCLLLRSTLVLLLMCRVFRKIGCAALRFFCKKVFAQFINPAFNKRFLVFCCFEKGCAALHLFVDASHVS